MYSPAIKSMVLKGHLFSNCNHLVATLLYAVQGHWECLQFGLKFPLFRFDTFLSSFLPFIFLVVCLLVVFFQVRVYLCGPGGPRTYLGNQTGLKLRGGPASAFQGMGLRMCTSMAWLIWQFSILRQNRDRRREFTLKLIYYKEAYFHHIQKPFMMVLRV